MIRETNDYILQVGDAINPTNENVKQAYQIINKVTEVVEVETTILPEAISMIEAFQGKLNEYREADMAVTATLADFDEGSNVRTLN